MLPKIITNKDEQKIGQGQTFGKYYNCSNFKFDSDIEW